MKTSPKLIAIHGLKGSGKDLTASMLRKYVPNSLKFAFGDRLKQMCSVAWDVPLGNFHDETLKEKPLPNGLTPRAMMTGLQGPVKDAFGDDFFAAILREAWAKAKALELSLIVTDLRFPVEMAICRELGASVLKVDRPNNPLYSNFSHVSERGLPVRESDFLLLNPEDKFYLIRQVRAVVEEIWGDDALKSYPFTNAEASEF